MGERQPSSPAKFALGLMAIGLSFCLLVPASALTASGKISPLWLAAVYFLDVVGELCLSPVGRSMVAKVAPARLAGLMMGAWFFATSLGNKLAGYSSGFFAANDPCILMRLYGGIAAGLLLSALNLTFAASALNRWMTRESQLFSVRTEGKSHGSSTCSLTAPVCSSSGNTSDCPGLLSP